MGRILLSICAVVVAVGLAGAQRGQPEGQNARRQTGSAESQSSPRRESPASSPSVEESLQRIACTMEAEQTSAASKQADEQASRDLRAQEDMAWWAQMMFWAAAAGVILSGFGVFLIWRTLLYTRTAANHSATLIVEAKATTKAAERAAEAAVADQRPWIRVAVTGSGPVSWTPEGAIEGLLNFTLSNEGKAPALQVFSSVEVGIRHLNGPMDFFTPHQKLNEFADVLDMRTGGLIMYPGDEQPISHQFRADPEAIRPEDRHSFGLCAVLMIRYKWGQGERGHTTVYVTIDPAEGDGFALSDIVAGRVRSRIGRPIVMETT